MVIESSLTVGRETLHPARTNCIASSHRRMDRHVGWGLIFAIEGVPTFQVVRIHSPGGR
jgi:hypothetical protein